MINRSGLREKVRLWFYTGRPLRRVLHPPKEKVTCQTNCETCKTTSIPNNCDRKNLVYQVNCTICKKIYIGETKRPLKQRINEHISDKSYSAINEHFKAEHPTYNIKNSISWEIRHNNLPYEQKRRIIESLYINQHKDNLMNGCINIYTA